VRVSSASIGQVVCLSPFLPPLFLQWFTALLCVLCSASSSEPPGLLPEQQFVWPHDLHVPVAFALGADCGQRSSWTAFTVYILTFVGDVFALCPIVPNGLEVSESDFAALKATILPSQQGNWYANRWLEVAWRDRNEGTDRRGVARARKAATRTFDLPASGTLFDVSRASALMPALQGPLKSTSGDVDLPETHLTGSMCVVCRFRFNFTHVSAAVDATACSIVSLSSRSFPFPAVCVLFVDGTVTVREACV
jgi:hypothetical protein